MTGGVFQIKNMVDLPKKQAKNLSKSQIDKVNIVRMKNVFPKRYQKAKITRITHTASRLDCIATHWKPKKASQNPFKRFEMHFYLKPCKPIS